MVSLLFGQHVGFTEGYGIGFRKEGAGDEEGNAGRIREWSKVVILGALGNLTQVKASTPRLTPPACRSFVLSSDGNIRPAYGG
jgi:hypothetical protein